MNVSELHQFSRAPCSNAIASGNGLVTRLSKESIPGTGYLNSGELKEQVISKELEFPSLSQRTVLSALQIFCPFTPEVPVNITKLKISFDMYLATDFRKAQRSLPQYRIVVFGGMDPIPSPAQFHELQTRFKDKVPLLRGVVMPNSVVFYNCSSISLPVDDKSHKT